MRVRRPALAALAASVTTVLGLAPLASNAAATAAGADAIEPRQRAVASGLDNPRQLTFGPRGRLYIAEAGAGGSGPCLDGPEGNVCFGASGAITKVTPRGVQKRIFTKLPSLAGEDGSSANGPSSVAMRGKRLTITVGLGFNPAVRADLPAKGQYLGHLIRGSIRGGNWRDIIDIAGYEASANPDGGEVDSNPNSVERVRRGFAIADAGGNSVVRLGNRSGELRTLTVLPFLDVPGVPFPVSPVPTSLTHGPKGALQIGQLTGFPFVKGAASVLRLRSDGSTKAVAEGLTNIMDVAYDGDTLYVVELAEEGLQNGPVGRLVRVNPDGSQETVVDGLFAPGGLALRHNRAYVSLCTVCADRGEVVSIPLS